MAVPIAIGIIAGVLFPAYRQAGFVLSFAQAKERIKTLGSKVKPLNAALLIYTQVVLEA